MENREIEAQLSTQEEYNWCPRCLPNHSVLVATEDRPDVVFCDVHGEMSRSEIERGVK